MKTVRSVLCVLALVPVAALASEMPAAAGDASDARCAAHQAEARYAAAKARMLRQMLKSDSVPTTGEFRDIASFSFVTSSLASAQNGLAPFTCAPKKLSAQATSETQSARSVRKVGPR